MAVKIKPVKRVNPQDVEQPLKYFAKAVSTGRSNIKRLATLISMQSTVSKADCLAVLTSLEENIILELNDGKIVELGEIGTLQIGVNSTGHTTEEEVSSNSVIKAKTLFRPGTELRKMLNNLSFRKGDAA